MEPARNQRNDELRCRTVLNSLRGYSSDETLLSNRDFSVTFNTDVVSNLHVELLVETNATTKQSHCGLMGAKSVDIDE